MKLKDPLDDGDNILGELDKALYVKKWLFFFFFFEFNPFSVWVSHIMERYFALFRV